MEKGIKLGVKIINDVSGLNYDKKSIKILKNIKFHLFYIIHKEIQKICN